MVVVVAMIVPTKGMQKGEHYAKLGRKPGYVLRVAHQQ